MATAKAGSAPGSRPAGTATVTDSALVGSIVADINGDNSMTPSMSLSAEQPHRAARQNNILTRQGDDAGGNINTVGN